MVGRAFCRAEWCLLGLSVLGRAFAEVMALGLIPTDNVSECRVCTSKCRGCVCVCVCLKFSKSPKSPKLLNFVKGH